MSQPARPQAVTSACVFVGASCFLVLWYVIDRLNAWTSIDVQEGLTDFFQRADVARLGLSTPEAIDVLRTVLLVAVVPLISGVVFAVYASRGHLASRLMLSVIAVLAALCFTITSGFLGLVVAAFTGAAVAQLWSREARTWFAVVNGRTPPQARPEPVRPVSAENALPENVPPAPSGVAVARSGPPKSVRTLDLVVTVASATAVLMSAGYLAIYLLVGTDAYVQQQIDSPISQVFDQSEAELVEGARVAAVLCAITLVLGIAALTAVRMLVAGRPGGHYALLVLAGVTVIMGVITLVGLPWAGAAIWSFVLLQQRETRAWVERSRGR